MVQLPPRTRVAGHRGPPFPTLPPPHPRGPLFSLGAAARGGEGVVRSPLDGAGRAVPLREASVALRASGVMGGPEVGGFDRSQGGEDGGLVSLINGVGGGRWEGSC